MAATPSEAKLAIHQGSKLPVAWRTLARTATAEPPVPVACVAEHRPHHNRKSDQRRVDLRIAGNRY